MNSRKKSKKNYKKNIRIQIYKSTNQNVYWLFNQFHMKLTAQQ